MKVNVKLIQIEMERQGLSRAQVAAATGITRQAFEYILKVESTTLKTLEQLGTALNRDPKDLIN